MALATSRLMQLVLFVAKNSTLSRLTLRLRRPMSASKKLSTDLLKARMARRSYLLMCGMAFSTLAAPSW
jgi:hypothetical protein